MKSFKKNLNENVQKTWLYGFVYYQITIFTKLCLVYTFVTNLHMHGLLPGV